MVLIDLSQPFSMLALYQIDTRSAMGARRRSEISTVINLTEIMHLPSRDVAGLGRSGIDKPKP